MFDPHGSMTDHYGLVRLRSYEDVRHINHNVSNGVTPALKFAYHNRLSPLSQAQIHDLYI